ncbi:MAG: PHP domain-containing protein [Gemmatimonadales bacterium]|nr:PHP domain-containing protein [Gemmatimonadales bacterium]
MIDLHCHSTASDGQLAPAEVVATAASCGLSTIALTDHDTIAGVAEAVAAGERCGVRVIAGCEFSVAAPWGEMHLLGYFLPTDSGAIEAFLLDARADRDRRARGMVSRLSGLGIAITTDQVLAESEGGAIGRPHVARALLRLGHVTTVQQAFDKYIGRGRPAFVDKTLPTLRAVADLVHAHGGIVSAAHLKSHGTLATVAALVADGLDAVETRHPSHDGDQIADLTEAAIALGIGRTGGSDWHGELDPLGTHAMLGAMQVPDDWLPPLEARRPVPTG